MDSFLSLRRAARRLARDAARIAWYYPFDRIDLWRGRRTAMTPPRWIVSTGGGDYEAVGNHLAGKLIEVTGLKPDQDMLDIGCGIGRVAVPLTRHLAEGGSYEGIDIQRRAIRWLQDNVTPDHPHFRFQWMDVYNEHYNPHGTRADYEFTFPYDDERFDVVYLMSVFSHMFPRGISRYLHEIARMLRPGGLCMASFYLITEDTEAAIRAGATARRFTWFGENFASSSKLAPEEAIAVDEAWLLAEIGNAGLELAQPIRYGDIVNKVNGQSRVVMMKPGRACG